MLLQSIIFGAFTGFLTDYWLKRASVKEPICLIVAVAVGVIIGVLVYAGRTTYF